MNKIKTILMGTPEFAENIFRKFYDALKDKFDIIAIITAQEILDIPKYKALNIHPSLLPCYRGASPIQSVILNGETETGVCLMIMDAEMDHGPILGISKFQILNPKITYKELAKELADFGAELLVKILPDWIEGKIKAQHQSEEHTSELQSRLHLVCRLL